MLSAEREKQIRQQLKDRHFGWPQALLAEIDRLRAELIDREANIAELEKVANTWMNDCDQLREKLEIAVDALQYCETDDLIAVDLDDNINIHSCNEWKKLKAAEALAKLKAPK